MTRGVPEHLPGEVALGQPVAASPGVTVTPRGEVRCSCGEPMVYDADPAKAVCPEGCDTVAHMPTAPARDAGALAFSVRGGGVARVDTGKRTTGRSGGF